MKKILSTVVLIFLFNFSFSTLAVELPKYFKFPKKYFKGKFYNSYENLLLVATTKLNDPRFKQSVIVILDHDEKGAIGLVVNKLIKEFPLRDLIDKSKNTDITKKKLYDVKIPIYWGGPIDEGEIFVLHSNDYKNDTTKFFSNLGLSRGNKILFEIAGKKGPKESLVIVGLSAWTLGQLDGEVEKGDWTFSEIKNDLIFNKENKIKWQTAIKNQFIPL